MTLDDAMICACKSVGVNPPKRSPMPGRWMRTDTYERNGKGDAEVMIQEDRRGVSVVNWQTGQRKTVRVDGSETATAPMRRDPAKEAREAAERAEVSRVCEAIVRSCRHDLHPYLARKGFQHELGLVHDNPRTCLPPSPLGEAVARAMPEGDGPFLIVPGRIGKAVTTVQFIGADGAKKNILRGAMSGASHRIATGQRLVVCEGIATALSVRAALRLLNVSATVLSAFSAANVAKVAAGHGFIAADHDKPLPQLHGKGTGEFYAAASGCQWSMPPVLGDFNDMHQRDGLRAVALHLREALMG